MQNLQNISPDNIFFLFLSTSMTQKEYMNMQPTNFSKFSSNLLQNAQSQKSDIQRNFKSNNNNDITYMILNKAQNSKGIILSKENNQRINYNYLLEPILFETKTEDFFKDQSIKHLKISENSCVVQKVFNDSKETKIISTEPLYINLQENKKISLADSKKSNLMNQETEIICEENRIETNSNYISQSFEKLSLPIEENCIKTLNNDDNIIENIINNSNQSGNLFYNKYDCNKQIKKSNPFQIITENINSNSISSLEVNRSLNTKHSANFPNLSFSKKNKSQKNSIISLNLSQRLSQIKMDPEKDQRKSDAFFKMISENSLDDILLQNKSNNKKSQLKEEKNISYENEEFFSLEQNDEDSEGIIKDPLINNPNNNTYFTKEKNYNDPIMLENEQNKNNYELTEYSSNESSNDGSYFYQWREFSDDFDIMDKEIQNNENSFNYMNLFNSNNNINQNSNNIFFSQKTAMFGIFNNNNNSNTNFNNYNTQSQGLFTSINFENNLLFKEKMEKRQSKLLSSPKKTKKKVKKLFCNAKEVPDWASDMNLIKTKVIEQNKTNPNEIFGEFIVENLDLGLLFNRDYHIFEGNR